MDNMIWIILVSLVRYDFGYLLSFISECISNVF